MACSLSVSLWRRSSSLYRISSYSFFWCHEKTSSNGNFNRLCINSFVQGFRYYQSRWGPKKNFHSMKSMEQNFNGQGLKPILKGHSLNTYLFVDPSKQVKWRIFSIFLKLKSAMKYKSLFDLRRIAGLRPSQDKDSRFLNQSKAINKNKQAWS